MFATDGNDITYLQILELATNEARKLLRGNRLIHGERYFKLTDGGEDVACIAVWRNCFHSRNTYIQPYFLKNDIDPKITFSFLKDYFATPLQCMLPNGDKRCVMLKSGGFKLVRRCFEREFAKTELKNVITGKDAVAVYTPEAAEYGLACKLLYETYAKNHESINPLTADFKDFVADLPKTVYCSRYGVNYGFAFTEENEICYVGGNGNLEGFFSDLINRIFSKYQSVVFEADDVDEAAMQLKDLFNDTCQDSFDTYIFTGDENDKNFG